MQNTKSIVHLRVYRPHNNEARVLKDENGNILNENHLVKIEHNSFEWLKYFKNVNVFYFKVEVEKVLKPTKDGKYEELKDIASYKKEVEDLLKPKTKVEQTPEQKRIAELEAKLDALVNEKTTAKKTKS
ncbi:hypothetical protein [Tenacibaculum sp.]|uniref:hypothetical protein n=1 Tax=Tenacibaculum sp. TaxID=1906242 RepID=UPI003D0E79EB